jgi:hypothetical protein
MADFYGDLGGRIGSDDESQISDVDPSQLAKMVEVSVTVFSSGLTAFTFRLKLVKAQKIRSKVFNTFSAGYYKTLNIMVSHLM